VIDVLRSSCVYLQGERYVSDIAFLLEADICLQSVRRHTAEGRDLHSPCGISIPNLTTFISKCSTKWWRQPVHRNVSSCLTTGVYDNASCKPIVSIFYAYAFVYEPQWLSRCSYWLRVKRPRFDSRQGQKSFLFCTTSRPTVVLTQPPIQRVPGALSSGLKPQRREADY
jgi:hypothetical protein